LLALLPFLLPFLLRFSWCVAIANLTYFVATFNTLRFAFFHTAKLRQFSCATKFQASNWGDFQQQLTKFSANGIDLSAGRALSI